MPKTTQPLKPTFKDTLTKQLTDEFGTDPVRLASLTAAVAELVDNRWYDSPDAMRAAPYDNVFTACANNERLARFIKAQYPTPAIEKPKDDDDQLVTKRGRREEGGGKQNITVKVDKGIDAMSAGELVQHLEDHPTELEAFNLLQTKPEYQMALHRGKKGAIAAINDADESLNHTVTIRYWVYLGRAGASPVSRYKGCKIVTFERALDIIERSIRHPLVRGAAIVEGMDRWGRDWTNFIKTNRTLLEAMLWAQDTENVLFPEGINPVTGFTQINTVPLPEPFSDILAEFGELDDDDPEKIVNVVFTEGGAGKTGDRKSGGTGGRGTPPSGEFEW